MLDSILHAGITALVFADAHGTGLAALAAICGVPVLISQITQSGRQEKRRIAARRLAALSTLPMTLHGINAWAKAAAETQTAVYPWAKGRAAAVTSPTYQSPPSPDHLIQAIERMIEASPNDRVAHTLAAIVSEIQILNSRLAEASSFTRENISGQRWSIDDNLIRAATIYSLAESLYEDARKLSDDTPRDFNRMAAALNIMNVRDGNHAEAHALLARMAKKQDVKMRSGYKRLVDWGRARLEPWRAQPVAVSGPPDSDR